MSSASLEFAARGAALRDAIDERWRKPPPDARRRWGIDMRDVVVMYIPIGSDFDEALQVLTAAGFTIKPRVEATADRPAMQAALIDPYATCVLCSTYAYIQLRTGPDADWRRVADVIGQLGIEWP